MNNKKGISLIVLVITIVIILILAGAIILSLVNNNPIGEAAEAKFKTNIDIYKSELNLAISNAFLNNHNLDSKTFDFPSWDGTGDGEGTIKEHIPSITKEDAQKFKIENAKLVYLGSEETEINWLKEVGVNIYVPTVDIDSFAEVNSTINGEIYAYNNPIIPKGFRAINDGAIWPTDWNKGLVIEDNNGNQFVWVPVDGTNVQYKKWCTINISYEETSGDELPEGVEDELSQIKKYGGFYISRYEAGKEGESTVVSKKGIKVYNVLNYMEATIKANSMYNTPEVKSGLLTGTQWDTVLSWIEKSGKNVLDTRDWGNHSDSVDPANIEGYGLEQVTGYSENWKYKNIYDFAGNVWEWTSEILSSGRLGRGGSFRNTGIEHTVVYRGYYDLVSVDSNLGFRIALFIK